MNNFNCNCKKRNKFITKFSFFEHIEHESTLTVKINFQCLVKKGLSHIFYQTINSFV